MCDLDCILSFLGRSDSVHYILLPEADMSLIDKVIERRVSRMQEIVELGRKSRDLHKLPLKFPCRTLVLVCSEPCFQVCALNMTRDFF